MESKETHYYLMISDSVGLPREGVRYEEAVVAGLSKGGHLWLLSRVGGVVTEFQEQAYELSKVLPEGMFELAVVCVGMADCAPRPMTAHLKTLVRRIPYPLVQKAVLKVLHVCRPMIQRLWYYQRVSPREFRMNYARLLLSTKKMSREVVVILIPPVREEVEGRSPGFHKEVERYNGIIKEVARSQMCDVIDAVEIFKERPEVYLTTDAHLTREGHAVIISLLKERYADI